MFYHHESYLLLLGFFLGQIILQQLHQACETEPKQYICWSENQNNEL